MHRPRFMLLCLLVLAMWAPVSSARADEDPVRPDVLLICVDDLNDWVGCLGGHPQAKTPNIDRLAKRGVLFTNAHCQSPVCWASRASFMSGKLPSTTGVYLLGGDFRESPELKDAKQLADLFNDAGYTTMGTGKIYHNQHGPETFQAYGPKQSFGPIPKKEEGGKINYKQGHALWDWGRYPNDEKVMPDYKSASWAAEQLKKKHDKPLFLAVGMCRPHVPMYAPPKYFEMFPPLDEIVLPEVKDDDRDDLPEFGKRLTAGFPAPRHDWFLQNKDDMQWQKAVKAYLASIAFADAQIGRVLDALDQSGRADKTIVILLSDHGFHMGEKQRWAKRSLWEESTKVPFIIAGPGIKPDRACAQPAGLVDMVPTLVDLCGLKNPGGLDGKTLLPQLHNAATPRGPALTTWWVGNHTLRSEHYRYIRYADGSEELYDHRKDPNEWNNLVPGGAHGKILEGFRQQLPKTDHPPLKINAALGVAPEDREFFGVRH